MLHGVAETHAARTLNVIAANVAQRMTAPCVVVVFFDRFRWHAPGSFTRTGALLNPRCPPLARPGRGRRLGGAGAQTCALSRRAKRTTFLAPTRPGSLCTKACEDEWLLVQDGSFVCSLRKQAITAKNARRVQSLFGVSPSGSSGIIVRDQRAFGRPRLASHSRSGTRARSLSRSSPASRACLGVHSSQQRNLHTGCFASLVAFSQCRHGWCRPMSSHPSSRWCSSIPNRPLNLVRADAPCETKLTATRARAHTHTQPTKCWTWPGQRTAAALTTTGLLVREHAREGCRTDSPRPHPGAQTQSTTTFPARLSV